MPEDMAAPLEEQAFSDNIGACNTNYHSDTTMCGSTTATKERMALDFSFGLV